MEIVGFLCPYEGLSVRNIHAGAEFCAVITINVNCCDSRDMSERTTDCYAVCVFCPRDEPTTGRAKSPWMAHSRALSLAGQQRTPGRPFVVYKWWSERAGRPSPGPRMT